MRKISVLIFSVLLSGLVFSAARAEDILLDYMILLDSDEALSSDGKIKQELRIYENVWSSGFTLEFRITNLSNERLVPESENMACLQYLANGSEMIFPEFSGEVAYAPIYFEPQKTDYFLNDWYARDSAGNRLQDDEFEIRIINPCFPETVELSCTVKAPTGSIDLEDEFGREQVNSLFYRSLDYLQQDGFLGDFAAGYFDGSRVLTEQEVHLAITGLRVEAENRSDLLPHQLLLIGELSRAVHADGLTRLPLSWERSLVLILPDEDLSRVSAYLGKAEESELRINSIVRPNHWAYSALEHFSKTEWLSDYPMDHFVSYMASRHEFAKALASLKDKTEQKDGEGLSSLEVTLIQLLTEEFALELPFAGYIPYRYHRLSISGEHTPE